MTEQAGFQTDTKERARRRYGHEMAEQAGDKKAATERLAQIHYQSDNCIAVYAAWPADGVVFDQPERISLLVVNQDSIKNHPGEVRPIEGEFNYSPGKMDQYVTASHVTHIIEVTPDEYVQIIRGEFPLPKGWERRRFIRRDAKVQIALAMGMTSQEAEAEAEEPDFTQGPPPATQDTEAMDLPRRLIDIIEDLTRHRKTSSEIRSSPAECAQFLSRMAGTPMTDHKAVRTARKILHAAQQLPHDLDVPQPNDLRGEGGIKIEWIFGRTCVELELWPDGDVQLHVEDDYEVVGSEMLTLGWNTRQETAWLP